MRSRERKTSQKRVGATFLIRRKKAPAAGEKGGKGDPSAEV